MIDGWDAVALLGALLLAVGLYLLAGIAWALLLVGLLMMTAGIAGARAPRPQRQQGQGSK